MLKHARQSLQHHTLSMAFPTRETLLWMSLWSEANFWTVSFILLQHCVKTSESVPDNSASWPIKKKERKKTGYSQKQIQRWQVTNWPFGTWKMEVEWRKISVCFEQMVTFIDNIFQVNSKKAILIFLLLGINFKILPWNKSLL